MFPKSTDTFVAGYNTYCNFNTMDFAERNRLCFENEVFENLFS